MVTSKLGIFYYIWYPANWSENIRPDCGNTIESGNTCGSCCNSGNCNSNISSTCTAHSPPNSWAGRYKPDVGIYNSNNESAMIQHLNWFKQMGIGFVICSWWGSSNEKGSNSNLIAFKNLLESNRNPYPEVKFCVYCEPPTMGSQTIINTSVDYIKNNFATSSYYLKINNKPVIWVYNTNTSTIGTDSAQWNNARVNKGIYTVLKMGGSWTSYINNSDSWHQYAPAGRYSMCSNGNIKYSSFVSPGFWRYHSNSRLTRADTLGNNTGYTEFENAIISMKNDGAEWKTIQTFNEWQENSGVEPASLYRHTENGSSFTMINSSYGTKYVDLIAKHFGSVPVICGSLNCTFSIT